MKCVACGKGKMVHDTRDVPYTYKGQTTIIPSVTGEFCPACDESLHTVAESERLSAAMLEFNKEVNSADVDPTFITATRRKLKLDQQEAARIFGGGANAFSRYENGKTRPSLALVQLFKILDKHPDLIDEIKPSQSAQVTAASVMKSSPLTRRKKTAARWLV
jgi:HTH-type transcriptional regulator/antitoxin MqsA